VSSRSRLLSPLLETFAAENGPSLGWLERDGSFFAALGAGGTGFGFVRDLARRGRTQHGDSLCLTNFAAFWFVLELFVVEEKLLAGRKNEI
jgi:hypothetical protein